MNRHISETSIATLLPLAYYGYHEPTLGCLVWDYDPCFCQKGGHKPTLVIPMSLQKYGGYFSEKKSACGNVPTSWGLPKIWRPFFWRKKNACGNVPTSWGFQKDVGHFSGTGAVVGLWSGAGFGVRMGSWVSRTPPRARDQTPSPALDGAMGITEPVIGKG